MSILQFQIVLPNRLGHLAYLVGLGLTIPPGLKVQLLLDPWMLEEMVIASDSPRLVA
jgi:hypothetical protein